MAEAHRNLGPVAKWYDLFKYATIADAVTGQAGHQ